MDFMDPMGDDDDQGLNDAREFNEVWIFIIDYLISSNLLDSRSV